MTDYRERAERLAMELGLIDSEWEWHGGVPVLRRRHNEKAASILYVALAAAEREGIERAAKIADQYASHPLGDPQKQDALEAFQNGMTYTTGGSDTASAITDAIRAAKEQP